MTPGVRLAVRGVLVVEGRLLLVNAWPGGQSPLWCAPGGGVEPGASLPDNLARELREETGLAVRVGAPCLVNEFHDPARGFHQVEVFFRLALDGPAEVHGPGWADPDGVVDRHLWVARDEMAGLMVKPDSLRSLPWEPGLAYDPLEPIAW